MDKQQRKEIGQAYAHSFRRMGIYQIRHIPSGKVLVASSMDIDGAFNKDRFMLDFGTHVNKGLQATWKEEGQDAFAFETVDELKPQEEYLENVQELAKYQKELKELEALWLEKLQPYEERGYNKPRLR